MTLTRTTAAALALSTVTAGVASAASPPTVAATISAAQLNPTTYQYTLNLTDLATSPSPDGTFWFAWTPGQDYLATSPLTVTNPAGWTDKITVGGPNDGFAVQWVAGAGAAVPAGASLGGFSFTSVDPPSSVFGNSAFFPTTSVLTSVAYSGTPFSDAGTKFLATSAVPEPASVGLLAAAALLGLRRCRSAARL